jgi:hypothetical protein
MEIEVASPSHRLSGGVGIAVRCELSNGGVVERTGGASRGGTMGEGDGKGVGVADGVAVVALATGWGAGVADGVDAAEDAAAGDASAGVDRAKASGPKDPLPQTSSGKMAATTAAFTLSRNPTRAS